MATASHFAGHKASAVLPCVQSEEGIRTSRDVVFDQALNGTGRETANFFAAVTRGELDRSMIPYQPVLDLGDANGFDAAMDRHRGFFDDHIGKSIPGHRDVQSMKGHSIVKTFEHGGRMVDIGASEGSLIKTISERSGGKIATLGVDPNPEMAWFFRIRSTVSNCTYAMRAFGDQGWINDDGTIIEAWKSRLKSDIVHEAMTLQFISNTRNGQIRRMKSILKPGGLLICEEKVAFDPESPSDKAAWEKKEKHKDLYKLQYFSAADLDKKRKDILEGAGQGDTELEGMHAKLVTCKELEEILTASFEHVIQFWDSTNFKGYAASDAFWVLERFINFLPDTSSEFSYVKTPRVVRGSRRFFRWHHGAGDSHAAKRRELRIWRQMTGRRRPRYGRFLDSRFNSRIRV